MQSRSRVETLKWLAVYRSALRKLKRGLTLLSDGEKRLYTGTSDIDDRKYPIIVLLAEDL